MIEASFRKKFRLDSCGLLDFSVIFSVCTVTQWKIKMQTIQYKTSGIWEMKEDKYTKSLAKNQVCAIFQMPDIRKNGLLNF